MIQSRPLAVCAILAAFILSPASAQDPTKKPERIRKNVGDGADVLAATFLGGKGHEWLAAGGFQPDGTIVVVGNVLGPTFDPGVPVAVYRSRPGRSGRRPTRTTNPTARGFRR